MTHSLGILSHLYISLNLPHLSSALLSSPSVTAFTSDSLLSQLLVARSNLATGPANKYQDAYYVFEEIKGMQGGRGEGVLAGVAVAQAALGRWEEARDATNEALEMVSPHPDLAQRSCPDDCSAFSNGVCLTPTSVHRTRRTRLRSPTLPPSRSTRARRPLPPTRSSRAFLSALCIDGGRPS